MNEMYILIITNVWTRSKYVYPVIYESKELADIASKRIPQAEGKNNEIDIIYCNYELDIRT